ncbi:MAG: carbamoyltransferase HypF, partial [Chloroflexota bacterium]
MNTHTERRRIRVEGIVQGVGFRPFVFNLAQRHALAGWVLNDAHGVVIEAEGHVCALDEFVCALEHDAPPLARITHVTGEWIPAQGERAFSIAHSQSHNEKHAFVSPDAVICDDCLRELFDPNDRRYRYPFINCTNCGPRFTIIREVPYDRPLTTMAPFVICADCQREYDDPHDRRFHAQPNACAKCGPTVQLRTADGGRRTADGYAAIETTAHLLRAGQIVAIKGLGGYHLACDATNDDAVAKLRARKQRYDKPFALMVGDVETARALCEISAAEEELLTSRRRPIVLLRQRAPSRVAAQVAPRQKYLGVMLPYTPLHYLLFEAFQRRRTEDGRRQTEAKHQLSVSGHPSALVMTSGNVSDEPIAFRDDDACARLSSLADFFLTHNREIHVRCDDSVVRIVNDQELIIRRSRGYAPEPIRAPMEFREPILATGAHLKNTFCLAKGQHAFVSHHIGDLENYETLISFTEGIEHFKRLFDIQPRVVAHDLHPEYLSTKYAQEQSAIGNLPSAVPVQHHHAHIASVMGEHGLSGPVIGVAFDGTGLGTDGTIWGGEFLIAEYAQFERAAHLDTIPLIGGEQAIHQVWRLAAAWLDKVYGDEWLNLDIEFVRRLDRAQWRVMKQMVARNLNAPRSSAMGRLFDAVAALIGVRDVANYEAQAAIELEMLADESCAEQFPFEILESGSSDHERPRVLTMDATMRAIVGDLQQNIARPIIAAKFHNTVAQAVAQMCAAIRRERGLSQVALGGGVFQNALLLTRTLAALQPLNFEVFVARQLPPNDGGIAFGQALVANAVL